jgi:hypothetical protein
MRAISERVVDAVTCLWCEALASQRCMQYPGSATTIDCMHAERGEVWQRARRGRPQNAPLLCLNVNAAVISRSELPATVGTCKTTQKPLRSLPRKPHDFLGLVATSPMRRSDAAKSLRSGLAAASSFQLWPSNDFFRSEQGFEPWRETEKLWFILLQWRDPGRPQG